MLNKKTNNFNDFSRYYSEENQELLEKKSKLAPYIIFCFLLILIFFSYLIYTYILNQKNTTSFEPQILTKDITSSSPIIREPSPKTPLMKQKEHIKKLVIEKIKEEKIIKINSKEKEEENTILGDEDKIITLNKHIFLEEQEKPIQIKENKKTEQIEVKKNLKKEPEPINTIRALEKKNLNELSLQLEELLKKKKTPLKNNNSEEFTHVVKEKFHIISNPKIIYRDEEFSIPIH